MKNKVTLPKVWVKWHRKTNPSLVYALRCQEAKYCSQDVPEVPLPELWQYVHLAQTHFPPYQPRQWHQGLEHHWRLRQGWSGFQVLPQTRTLAHKHLSIVLTHGVNELQSWSQSEVHWGCIWISTDGVQGRYIPRLHWWSSQRGGVHLLYRGQTVTGRSAITPSGAHALRGTVLSKHVVFRVAAGLVEGFSVKRFVLWLGAPFFERRQPVLALQSGAALCFHGVWGFAVSSGFSGQQLLEGSVIVHRGVLGFIQGDWTETTVFRHRPVPE